MSWAAVQVLTVGSWPPRLVMALNAAFGAAVGLVWPIGNRRHATARTGR